MLAPPNIHTVLSVLLSFLSCALQFASVLRDHLQRAGTAVDERYIEWHDAGPESDSDSGLEDVLGHPSNS